MKWPAGRGFAFTIFDDPDAQTLSGARQVYDFLSDAGFRTTIGVWPSGPTRQRNSLGETCADDEYRRYAQELKSRGFEVGYHNTTAHSSMRNEIANGLEQFTEFFGDAPITMANHYNAEAIYWGKHRLGGVRQLIYRAATLRRNAASFSGHLESSPYFWGDLCARKIRFCRNFTCPQIDTLRAYPRMPYHDTARGYVKYWYASSDGATIDSFLALISEKNQDELEAGNGACIVYTHFGLGFVTDRGLDPRFRRLMDRLRQKSGWFVPVGTLLDYLLLQSVDPNITDHERREMEWRWLGAKMLHGSS